MKRFMLRLLILFCSTVISFAQGDSPDCDFALVKTDLTCTDDGLDCNENFTGCTTQTFTVPCTQAYYFHAYVVYSGGADCTDCRACVSIYNGHTFVANSHTHECDLTPGSCKGISATANLVINTTYTLYVCLSPCPYTSADCDDCSDNCYAKTCLHSINQACPFP
jgi:hypothetical protein